MSKLYFRYSTMNADKSLSLLQFHHNYKSETKHAEIYNSKLDDRYGVGFVTTRLGLQQPAKIYDKETNFLNELDSIKTDNLHCILIDESQFLTKNQIRQIHQWVHTRNVSVICFGIRSDFLGNRC